MKRILNFLIFCFFCTVLTGQEQQQNFTAANTSYEEANYKSAFDQYQALINNNQESSELYYNYANAAFKLNKLSTAILYYERALKLSPGDQRINNNLGLAYGSVDTEIIEIPDFLPLRLWKGLCSKISPMIWLVFQFALAMALIYGIYLWRLNTDTKARSKGFKIGVISAFLFLFAFLARSTSVNLNNSRDNGIVMKQTILKSAPDQRSDDLKELSEGVKIKVADSIDDWYKVQLANKETGWINSKNIEVI